MIARATILAEARSWIGTPYRHQASVKGAGCDCLGLVRGVWRALYGEEPEPVPPYTPDWAEARGEGTLLQAALRYLAPAAAPAPGDVLLFRMAHGAPMKHAAILAEDERLIHAYWGRAVVESRFAPWWRARLGAAFSFPGAAPWPN
ncbi:MAG: C40 family peptidase [Hydrogenophilaceae bacterium]|jgi:NlpC/P60 family putative phage cell wall peptidase|nr:C40 family peptidase [Hydrogenophilaceae bacterium]